ncbi:MAG TPA: ATP-binding cassette domain-containing protein [Stellaceae bacterium]
MFFLTGASADGAVAILYLVPKAEIERRLAWVSGLLQIGGMLDRQPSQLSGGQRQRVAIGRVPVQQAKVLLLDEPLSNLDAKLRTEMRFKPKRLHQALAATIIYVTHDKIEAMTLATRIALMRAGKIEQYATPDALMNDRKRCSSPALSARQE